MSDPSLLSCSRTISPLFILRIILSLIELRFKNFNVSYERIFHPMLINLLFTAFRISGLVTPNGGLKKTGYLPVILYMISFVFRISS